MFVLREAVDSMSMYAITGRRVHLTTKQGVSDEN